MPTKWDEINEGLLSYFLDDIPAAGGTYQFPLPNRINGWNWAQRQLAIHTARECSILLEIEDGGRTAGLPSDLIEIGTVYDAANQRTYARKEFGDGQRRADDRESYAYWTWAGKLRFDRTIGRTEKILLEYYGAWPEVKFSVTDGDVAVVQDEIQVPDWSELALAHFTAAVVLQPPAITAAMSNEYKIKIDSGTPLDNPREQQSRAHMWWWNELLGARRPQVRIVGR